MNNLHLSEEAQKDLIGIKTYIIEELMNESAALGIVGQITNSLRILQTYAEAGPMLSSIADIESDYRFIVRRKLYLVFIALTVAKFLSIVFFMLVVII